MDIAVCVKVYKGDINPFDECALEEALKIPNAKVWVFAMCPMSGKDRLLQLTRLGIHKLIMLSDPLYAGSDTLATSYILYTALKQHRFAMVFCGRQSVDGDTAQVGPQLSARLGFSLITNVLSIDMCGETIQCTTRFGREEAPLPVVLTVERINTLRFPSIFSKVGEMEIKDNAAVGADLGKIGSAGSPTKVIASFENQKGKRKCAFLQPEDFLSVFETAVKSNKAAFAEKESQTKLKHVWAIGQEVYRKALLISDDVTLIRETDPYTLAEMARAEQPRAILWNADLQGRKTAPITAVLLEAGLCADCTALETDGEKLYMYRPAIGGNIIAKIESKTIPYLATVRCAQRSDDVVVSAGRGVSECITEVKAFAEKLHADLSASRTVVDKGLAPYSAQVGLTGKTISPKIYIAVGISGAVQHVCAIEGADTVIAVNPDKDAPIFEYADYGIVSDFESFCKKVGW